MSELGDRIKTRRLYLGLSRPELGDRAGLSEQGLYYLETGRREEMRSSTRRRLAHAMGVTEDWLKTGLTKEKDDEPLEEVIRRRVGLNDEGIATVMRVLDSVKAQQHLEEMRAHLAAKDEPPRKAPAFDRGMGATVGEGV